MDGFGISVQNTLFSAKDQEQEVLSKRAGHTRVSATTYRTGTSSWHSMSVLSSNKDCQRTVNRFTPLPLRWIEISPSPLPPTPPS